MFWFIVSGICLIIYRAWILFLHHHPFFLFSYSVCCPFHNFVSFVALSNNCFFFFVILVSHLITVLPSISTNLSSLAGFDCSTCIQYFLWVSNIASPLSTFYLMHGRCLHFQHSFVVQKLFSLNTLFQNYQYGKPCTLNIPSIRHSYLLYRASLQCLYFYHQRYPLIKPSFICANVIINM